MRGLELGLGLGSGLGLELELGRGLGVGLQLGLGLVEMGPGMWLELGLLLQLELERRSGGWSTAAAIGARAVGGSRAKLRWVGLGWAWARGLQRPSVPEKRSRCTETLAFNV